MRHSAAAFIVPLAAGEESAVEIVNDDIDACTLIYSDPPTVEMIEEELCFVSPDGTHTYIKAQNYCMHCGMAAPWVRRDACRS